MFGWIILQLWVIEQYFQFTDQVAGWTKGEVFLLIGIYRITKGVFDITLGALSVLWKSAEERGYVPTEEEIREARTRVGADNFVLDPEHFTVTRSKDGVILDLGAIGKGYAIDRAVGVLKSRGIQEAMINAGGAIHNVTGENGKPHSTMGIRNPKDPETILATVDLGNEGISTSGAYERFYTIGENNYDHIVHREGGTARQKPLSVSVISKSSTLADIYSTAMYVAGFDEGKKIFSQSSGIIGAIFITNDEGHGVRIESLGNIQITETHTAPGI